MSNGSSFFISNPFRRKGRALELVTGVGKSCCYFLRRLAFVNKSAPFSLTHLHPRKGFIFSNAALISSMVGSVLLEDLGTHADNVAVERPTPTRP